MEFDSYLRFLLALLFVLGLIGGAALLARRFLVGARFLPKPGRSNRLRIEEVLPIDARRRLVLVRHDRCEHLLLLGAGQDLVVHSDSNAPVSSPAPGTAP